MVVITGGQFVTTTNGMYRRYTSDRVATLLDRAALLTSARPVLAFQLICFYRWDIFYETLQES